MALPASDQTAWVESLGVGPVVDELALELGDGARLADQFVAKGWLGSEALPPLQAGPRKSRVSAVQGACDGSFGVACVVA